jgi:hypothetical protein
MSYIPINSMDLEKNKYLDKSVLVSQLQSNTIAMNHNDMEFVVLNNNTRDIFKNYTYLQELDSLYRNNNESNSSNYITSDNDDTTNNNIIKIYIGSITVVCLFIYFRILQKTI